MSGQATIILSYAHDHSDFVRSLTRELHDQAGGDRLIIRSDITALPGEWRKSFRTQLESADLAVLVLSKAYLASAECGWELGQVLDVSRQRGSVIILPILLEQCDYSHVPELAGPDAIRILPDNRNPVLRLPPGMGADSVDPVLFGNVKSTIFQEATRCIVKRERIHTPPQLIAGHGGSLKSSGLPNDNALIPRLRHLTTVRQHLSDPESRAVFIEGMPGSGKTSIALMAAHQWVLDGTTDARQHAVGQRRVIWLPSPNMGRGTLALADVIATGILCPHIHKLVNEDEKWTAIQEVFGGDDAATPVLLIIDGLRADITGHGRFRSFLASLASHVKILATVERATNGTTRAQAPGPVRSLRVGDLETREALLVIEGLNARQGRRTIEAVDPLSVQALARACRHPMILRWSTGLLLQNRVAFPALLTVLAGDGVARDPSVFMKAVARYFDPPEQKLLAAMSFFRGVPPRAALAKIAHLSEADVLRCIIRIRDALLLDHIDDMDSHPSARMSMTEKRIIRQCMAYPELDQEFVRYYRDFVTLHGNWNDNPGLARIQNQLPDIIQSLEMADIMGNKEDVVAIYGKSYNALWNGRLWGTSLYWAGIACDYAEECDLMESAAWIRLQALGWLHFELGRHAEARGYYNKASEYFKEDDHTGKSRSFNYLGRLALAEGNYQEGRRLLWAGLRYADDPMTMTFIESALGDLSYRASRYDEAAAHYQAVRSLRIRMADEYRLASVEADLGDIHLIIGAPEVAQEHYEAGLGYARKTSRFDIQGRCHKGLADTLMIEAGGGNRSDPSRDNANHERKLENARGHAYMALDFFRRDGKRGEHDRTSKLIDDITRILGQLGSN